MGTKIVKDWHEGQKGYYHISAGDGSSGGVVRMTHPTKGVAFVCRQSFTRYSSLDEAKAAIEKELGIVREDKEAAP